MLSILKRNEGGSSYKIPAIPGTFPGLQFNLDDNITKGTKKQLGTFILN
jgi:hypothetical protein